jgi:5'-deoxynucleotidase
MINLQLALKASEVKRWAIVRLTREQSVAEHMYNVFLLSDSIYEYVFNGAFATQVPSFTRQELIHHALTHDLPEVLTGDLPTTLKPYIAPDALAAMEEETRARLWIGAPPDKDSQLACLLKIADTAEAMMFLHLNGGHDRPTIWNSVHRNYHFAHERARALHPHVPWYRAHIVLSQALDDPRWPVAVSKEPT